MNHLFRLNSLNAVLRSLKHESVTLRELTTCSSLLRTHSNPSRRRASSLIVRNFASSRNSSYEIPPPMNLGIRVVPERMAYVVERLGNYYKTLHSGVHFLIPLVDKIVSVHSLKDKLLTVPEQTVLTQDNVSIEIGSLFYVKVEDPKLASYGPEEDPFDASIYLAQKTISSIFSKLALEKALQRRDGLSDEIVELLNKDLSAWGLKCIRYVITDITPPVEVRESMEEQADAERRKRIKILESEGERDAAINKAEGERRAAFLAAEGELAKADAASKGISLVAKSLTEPGGIEAASLNVAKQYIAAFGNLAKEGTNTVLLPNGAKNFSSLISQAMTLYKTVGGNPSTAGFAKKLDESSGGVKAETPCEESKPEINIIDEDKESGFSLQNRNVIDEPGFSMQTPSNVKQS